MDVYIRLVSLRFTLAHRRHGNALSKNYGERSDRNHVQAKQKQGKAYFPVILTPISFHTFYDYDLTLFSFLFLLFFFVSFHDVFFGTGQNLA